MSQLAKCAEGINPFEDADYRAQREQALRRRLFEYSFRQRFVRAVRGDTKPLREYLQSDARLLPEHRQWLADLLKWRIEKHEHRRRGEHGLRNLVLSLAREGEYLIIAHVKALRKKRFGDRKLEHGALKALIDEVADGLYESGALDEYPPLDIKRVRCELNRKPKPARSPR